jgi:hypothetical protein
MSSINSSSTLVEVENAYDDNASYAEDGSVAKAKAFITACRLLIRRLPAEASSRESHLRLSPDLIRKEMEAAQAYVAANDTGTSGSGSSGPAVTVVSFENFR